MAPSMQAINQHSIDHMEKSINQTLSGSKKNLRQALIEAQNPDVIVDTSDVSYYRWNEAARRTVSYSRQLLDIFIEIGMQTKKRKKTKPM